MMSTRGRVWPSVTLNGVAVVCARAGDRDELTVVEQADANQAGLRRDEGLDIGGVALGDGAGAVDVVVGDDQHAAALRPLVGGDADGVVDVERTVGAEGRRRSHRAGEHDRLVALDDEVEEVGGLLHRVGAVGDGNAVDVGLRQQAVDLARQLHPQLVVHVDDPAPENDAAQTRADRTAAVRTSGDHVLTASCFSITSWPRRGCRRARSRYR